MSIWYRNPSVLLELPYDFFPSNRMTVEEILNSIVRMAFYICIILLCLEKQEKGIFVLCISLILTYLLHTMHTENEILLEENKKIKPTNDNPFMNIQLSEYAQDSEKKQNRKIDNVYGTCEDENIKRDIAKKFKTSIDGNPFQFNTVDNVFGRNTSERQFYTMPVTSIPSQRGEFASWLYENMGPTCKENNNACRI